MGCKHTCPIIVNGYKKSEQIKQSIRISPGPGISQRDVSQVTTITTGHIVPDCISTEEDSFCTQPHFTELQVDIINSTWPIIEADLQTQGVMMFLDLFRLEPDAQQMFAFR